MYVRINGKRFDLYEDDGDQQERAARAAMAAAGIDSTPIFSGDPEERGGEPGDLRTGFDLNVAS